MSKKQEVMGTMAFGYKTYALPLRIAHEIQALLAAHGVVIDEVYCTDNPKLCVFREMDTPAVTVTDMRHHVDAVDMSSAKYSEWRDIAASRGPGDPLIDPKDYEVLQS